MSIFIVTDITSAEVAKFDTKWPPTFSKKITGLKYGHSDLQGTFSEKLEKESKRFILSSLHNNQSKVRDGHYKIEMHFLTWPPSLSDPISIF